MSTYARIAIERWPHATIFGTDGRYAVICPGERVVYLALTEQQAHNIGRGIEKPVYEDLAPKPQPKRCLNIHDNDADDRRRARDEARREQSQ